MYPKIKIGIILKNELKTLRPFPDLLKTCENHLL